VIPAFRRTRYPKALGGIKRISGYAAHFDRLLRKLSESLLLRCQPFCANFFGGFVGRRDWNFAE
jgi:hypothetical protein